MARLMSGGTVLPETGPRVSLLAAGAAVPADDKGGPTVVLR
jgi:hypothetical protein